MMMEQVHRASARTAFAGLFGLALVAPAASWAQDDQVAAGEKVFKRCAACHAIGPGAENKVGPELNAVIGRTAGSLEGYSYSNAMKEAGAGGLVWTSETLHTYLENPKGLVPGTKMTFAGLKKLEDRDAVIVYLTEAGAGS